MITMLVMPERRFASTHFSSWPMTLALHTAVSTSRCTAVLRSTAHSGPLSSTSQLVGHSASAGAIRSSARVPRGTWDGAQSYGLPPVYASTPRAPSVPSAEADGTASVGAGGSLNAGAFGWACW